jgi:GT2 family glycosyltransferase
MIREPLVSIVTINYNNTKVTLELLLSISECTYKNVQVIVVDNGSIENPIDKINDKFPQVEVIRSEKNLGFSAGNNLGLKKAKGVLIFFVNNDTLFAENLIEELIKPFFEIKNLGIVSPKVIYYESPNLLQYAGSTDINPLTGRNKVIGQGQADNDSLFPSGVTFFAHGAAMIIRKNLLKKIGGFPDVYFLYYEELDYSIRLRRAGYKIYYNNNAVIYHRVSHSVGEESPLKVYYMTRNRILFMRRNFPGIKYYIFVLFFTFFTVPKNTLKYAFRLQFQSLVSFYRAIAWNINTSTRIKMS